MFCELMVVQHFSICIATSYNKATQSDIRDKMQHDIKETSDRINAT